MRAGPDAVARDTDPGTEPGAVVLIHNIFCDSRVFAYTSAVLQARFRTITVDLRGHGESPVPARPYEIVDLVDDVVAILDAEKIARATVVGVSIGATVAIELALAHADRVDRLVLMGADAAADSPLNAMRNALFCGVVRLVGMRNFVLKAVSENLFGQTFRREGGELYRVFRSRLAAFDRRAAALAMAAWSGRRDLTRLVRVLRVPTLVVVGDEDVSCPPPCGEELASALPDAKLVHIPAAGHTMTAERPRETTAAVLGFLGVSV
jgi:3-oxoadipate enol-lactonase